MLNLETLLIRFLIKSNVRFGHEDGVTAIDSLTRDRAVTVGGRDRTLRVWKVVEESQLVFTAQGNM